MFILELFVAAAVLQNSASASWLSSSDSCYLPNGTIEPSLKACSADGNRHSSCCYDKSACSDSGYCYGLAGVLYRGGCTDKSWESGKCSQQCTHVFKDTYSNILVLPGTAGIDLDIVCAGPSSCPLGACNTNVVIQGRDDTNQVSAGGEQVTSMAVATVWATAVATSMATAPSAIMVYGPEPRGPPSAKTVGLAVGLPLGLIALASSIGCFYLWRKLRMALVQHSTAFKDLEEDEVSVVERHEEVKEAPPNYEKQKPSLTL